ARLRRDDELVAVRAEVAAHELAERPLRRAVRRAVVVREVEVRDPEVERAPHDRPARLERPVAAEVPPETERDRGQLQAARAAAPVLHPVVPLGRGDVGHQLAAPVMIATASGIEWVCGVTTATRRPRRMIEMRSASSKTCGMSWLIRITGRPRSRTRRIRSITWPVSLTPRAAVGSSMITSRRAHVAARA